MSGSPTIASLFAQRVVVGVGDMAVSNNQSTILSTYALGSCIGVIAFDPVARCGGILHLMLPEAAVSPDKAAKQPAMFADTGLPLFFKSLVGLRAERSNLRLFVAGGASVMGGSDPFKIGERNTTVTNNFLNLNRLNVLKTDTGGSISRTVHLELSTGMVNMITPNAKSQVSLAA
jgi:chemotaxis protein CheD